MTDPIPNPRRKRVQFRTTKPSRTKQAPKDEVNVNIIVEEHRRTGKLPSYARIGQAIYGDFASFDDYHSQANRLMAAQSAFEELPATTRRMFDDDPEELVRVWYSDDPLERQKLVDANLIPEPVRGGEIEETPPSQPVEETPAGPQVVIPGTERSPAQ